MTQRSCPICHNHHHELLFTQKFTAMSSGSLLDSYDVVVCQECGFGYADNIPDQSVFDTYYQEMSKYEYQENSGQESHHDLARFRSITDILTPFLPSFEARILDIGCATGKLLSLIKKCGYNYVLGLDPSPVCAKTAHNLYNISVSNDSLWDLSKPLQLFDCIIFSGVLEHIRDLNRCLDKVAEILAIGGILQIEVPDVSCFSNFTGAPFQEFSTEHIDFFSSTSLDNLLQTHGFHQLFCERNVRKQSDSTVMPVITAIYQHTSNKNREFVFDSSTKNSLLEYISQSKTIETNVRKIIDNVVDSRNSIIVWGVGTHTQRLLATSNLSQANICAFVDSNPRYQGKFLQEIPIISPTKLMNYREPIVISSQVFQSEIQAEIKDNLKLENQLILLY
jgi:SAM-dependent methyltransferase